MNCTCLSKQETRIEEGFKTGQLKAPERAKGVRSVTCQSHGLNFTTGKMTLGTTFNAYFDGRVAPWPVRMLAAFCPFCGKPTAPPDSPEPPTAAKEENTDGQGI